jgi:hypothetical protein
MDLRDLAHDGAVPVQWAGTYRFNRVGSYRGLSPLSVRVPSMPAALN